MAMLGRSGGEWWQERGAGHRGGEVAKKVEPTAPGSGALRRLGRKPMARHLHRLHHVGHSRRQHPAGLQRTVLSSVHGIVLRPDSWVIWPGPCSVSTIWPGGGQV